MAAEMQLNQLVFASQEDMKHAYMWSLGLVMRIMINPDFGSPYRAELEQSGVPDIHVALEDLLTKRRLPQHGTKYEQLRITSWWQLEDIFNRCANFDEMARASTAQMLCLINKSLVNDFRRLPLSISQSMQYDAHLATNLQGNMHLSTLESTHFTFPQTTHFFLLEFVTDCYTALTYVNKQNGNMCMESLRTSSLIFLQT
jgi:hypothetical protein